VRAGGLERIETARMLGERLAPEHARELAALLGDPRVARTLSPTEGPRSEARVREIVASQAAAWELDGIGMWLLRDRADGAMVGRGGLQHTLATGSDEVEIGWAIVPERWGQGLATELAHASIEVAFGELQLDSVIAYSLVSNGASRRVMEKAGLVYERDFEHVSLPHVIYRRRREV
jgi:[ribosomal protein S5]-alanine N-acetyltransferase